MEESDRKSRCIGQIILARSTRTFSERLASASWIPSLVCAIMDPTLIVGNAKLEWSKYKLYVTPVVIDGLVTVRGN